jgi:phage tail sheath protein FI
MPQYLTPGVYVEEVPSAVKPIAGAGTSTAGFIGIVPDSVQLPGPIQGQPGKFAAVTVTPAAAGKEVKLVTSWSDFVKYFGDLIGPEQPGTTAAVASVTIDDGYRHLAQGVYGFFNNGGTRCFVVRITTDGDFSKALDALAAIDEIAIVAIPGITTQASQEALIAHCETLHSRFAILDGAMTTTDFTKTLIQGATRDSSYSAIYFPWIKVFDPSERLMHPTGDGTIVAPPSGHLAGVYARVDTDRGVHKAPANEPIMGALDVVYRLTKAQQDGLNPPGVNVIRVFDSNKKVWGARTMGGDANADFKYVNVRRVFIFLRESIDRGTQWVVFEPNDPRLWAKITRNVSAFLTNVWRAGALFGTTPQEAFYVKCDAETNPPELRDLGQVVTEIGVAIVRPAEFVIFRISQWAGPQK